MAKYGLGGGKDLNLLAQLALGGLLETPERHIAALMRSSQPIELETRQSLANALEGKSNGGSLELKQKGRGKVVRRFQEFRARIKLGREVRALQTDLTYECAVKKVAEQSHESEKNIQRFRALSRKCDNWIDQHRNEESDLSNLALECA